MDWEQLRERTLGEVSTALVTQGAGVAGGFVGAAFVGRQVQNLVKKDADIVTMTDKVMAWTANNVPKIAIWYLARGYAIEPGETVTPMKEAISDARKAMAGSVVFDTLMRLANSGVNPASATLWNWQILEGKDQKSVQADTHRLIQENSALRAELNKALQRLATKPTTPTLTPAPTPIPAAIPTPVQTIQQAPPVVRYTPVAEQRPVVSYSPAQQARPVIKVEQTQQPVPQMVRAEPVVVQQQPPPVAERERRYGFMREVTPPAVQERERKFGFMAGGEKDIATMFGML